MKIEIVNYESTFNNGILTKFATRLNDELVKLGQDSSVVAQPTGTADITHHVNYLPYKHNPNSNTVNSLMITHIWEGYKLDSLKQSMKTADVGICFSSIVPKELSALGLPKDKLTYVLPAHDERPRRHQIVAILTNVYPDGCKREQMFIDLVKTLDYNKWAFRIMGSGWENILAPLVADGLQVDYFHDFDKDIHDKIIDSSDYALYFGMDEGSMGLLDACNAGLKTIGTPQGFHLDMGLDYSFTTQKELNAIFAKLSENRVATWTWENHAKAHLNIWNKLINEKK